MTNDQELKQDIINLRDRIESLEMEVDGLKCKLRPIEQNVMDLDEAMEIVYPVQQMHGTRFWDIEQSIQEVKDTLEGELIIIDEDLYDIKKDISLATQRIKALEEAN